MDARANLGPRGGQDEDRADRVAAVGPLDDREYQRPADPRSRNHPSQASYSADPRRQPQLSQQQPASSPPQPSSPPPLQTHDLPPSNPARFSWSQTPRHAQARPTYVLDDASPTTIDETSPVSAFTGTGSGTGFSALSAARGIENGTHFAEEGPVISPMMPSPDGAKATYSLYPRATTPHNGSPPRGTRVSLERARTPSQTARARDSPPAPDRTTTPRNAPMPGEIHPAHFAPYAEVERGGLAASPERTRTPGQQQQSPQRTRTPGQQPSPERTRTPGQQQSPERTRTPGQQTHQSPYQQYQHQHQRTTSGPPLRVNTKSSHSKSTERTSATAHFPHHAPPIPPSTDTKEIKTPTMSTPHLTPRTPTYDPHALGGPNVDAAATHRPGQISHPNAATEPQWKHGLCAADLLCLEGLCCPCIVYGRTQYRLGQKAQHKEATDLLGYSAVNGSCTVMALACGVQWILTLIQRTRVRKLYNIDGAFGSDCGVAFCCCGCALAQHEREVRGRETARQRHAGPASVMANNVPYVGLGLGEGMQYVAPAGR